MINSELILSDEQQQFVSTALIGKNILVDACIGSGKTTVIQQLCNIYPSNKKILYLTYNRLLKIDAKNKIHKKNVTVTNYHGFAYMMLKKVGKSVGVSDLIQTFLHEVDSIPGYDVLIIDEYQDIEQELAELLIVIKKSNPQMQIIAVGDMEQKIYDKTSLDVAAFIDGFLEEYEKLQFTKCFRISEELAATLGRIWNKTIVGVNRNCLVEEMTMDEVVDFLSKQNPEDILCLGQRNRSLADALNKLENGYPQKFNKSTVYASIADYDSNGATEPKTTSAIFTTYDSSKGLERNICVIFDYTEEYWSFRINQPQVSYEILRNIFCVAASRGKEKIIFVKEEKTRLSEKTLSTFVESKNDFKRFDMSKMFEFKYKEDIEKCFAQLKISKIEQEDRHIIVINNKDELIDLSPCIGIYQEAVFFDNYNIDLEINLKLMMKKQEYKEEERNKTLDEKILLLTSLETNQRRYRNQVKIPFVTDEQKNQIVSRLQSKFTSDVNAQVKCELHFATHENGAEVFNAIGYADVVLDDTVFELKFVSELTHEHYLQCACYMAALNIKKGVLWNTRDNSMYCIEISDTQIFLDLVTSAITKGVINKYYKPNIFLHQGRQEYINNIYAKKDTERFAVIDVETTWDDKVMSIGVVIGNSRTLEKEDAKYYLINPECTMPGMYSSILRMPGINEYYKDNRKNVLEQIVNFLSINNVNRVLAYNASFDKNHLNELSNFVWCDIMRIAAYKQFNKKIPEYVECYGTGKMKKGYGVESILRMLSGDDGYTETHNAFFDAMDELKIIQLLGCPIETYDIGIIGDRKTSSRSVGKDSKNDFKIEDDNISVEKSKEEKYNEQKRIDLQNSEGNNISSEKTCGVEEAADMLGISKSTVYNMIKRGDINAVKQGNRYVISLLSVQEYKKKILQATIMSGLILIVIIIILCLLLLN